MSPSESASPSAWQVNVNRRRFETLCINGIFLELQIDTGSDIAIVSNEAWKTFGSPKLDTVLSKVSSGSVDAVTSNISCASAKNANKRERTPFAEIPYYVHNQKPRGSGHMSISRETPSNKRRGSQKNGFAVNKQVYARDYRLGHQWIAAIITKRHGSMIYNVEVGKNTQV
ncbi:unnamed protein product [Hymenolepis diminuta]|uniref:Peptidase A2 domain-containing protein n=1 Tax=Hymenolepis diminuta TaxID=6216 RepID=A0A564YB48_HYMDI|nr:unnamed protein product [Hymenolepis diminuta]